MVPLSSGQFPITKRSEVSNRVCRRPLARALQVKDDLLGVKPAKFDQGKAAEQLNRAFFGKDFSSWSPASAEGLLPRFALQQVVPSVFQ
jgi:hypothetical protein